MTEIDQWYTFTLEQESAEQFAESFIEEIIKKSQDVLFEKHLESQVLPYAVSFTQDTLSNMIKWEFFKKDMGFFEGNWEQDKEPLRCPFDSWARGIIPVVKTVPKELIHVPVEEVISHEIQEEEGQVPITISESSSRERSAKSQTNTNSARSRELPKSARIPLPSLQSPKLKEPQSQQSAVPPPPPDMIRKQAKHRAIPDHTLKQETIQVTKKLNPLIKENYRMFQKIRKMEKETTGVEYTYDQDGKIVFIRRPTKSKFATQSVKTRVLDQDENPSNITLPNYKPPPEKPLPRLSRIGSHLVSSRIVSDLQHNGPTFVQDNFLEAPNTSEAIKLNTGVVYREGDSIRKGPPMSRQDLELFAGNFDSEPGSSCYSNYVTRKKPDESIDLVLNQTKPTVKPYQLPLKPIT